ncbi:MAG: hypothetical protein IPG50_36665 [Myxococcales bacterium]|nr:hypothetical protein [Myxococcales bacterium]
MNGPLVVGVDASTTACKAIAFELDGTPVAEGRRALALVSRGVDGWEQDAESWWTATLEALGELTTALGPDRERVRAMAVAHQRETFVMTDAAGAPLHPALVWMDARCKDEVARATTTLGAEHLHAVTGKPPCVTPSFYKASFLLSRLAPALTRARPRLLDVHAFLVQRLTGEFVTSLASADPLGLVDMKARDWSDELLGYLSLDRGSVPTLVEPGAPVGALRSHVADRTGLPPRDAARLPGRSRLSNALRRAPRNVLPRNGSQGRDLHAVMARREVAATKERQRQRDGGGAAPRGGT